MYLADIATDDQCVDMFAIVMKGKLAKKREQGRTGWQELTASEISLMLREHVEKGDPVDVANFCMMLALKGKVIV